MALWASPMCFMQPGLAPFYMAALSRRCLLLFGLVGHLGDQFIHLLHMGAGAEVRGIGGASGRCGNYCYCERDFAHGFLLRGSTESVAAQTHKGPVWNPWRTRNFCLEPRNA